MKDKYDEAIEYLTQYPYEILGSWSNPRSSKAGCLFNYCGIEGYPCACLTQIRIDNCFVAQTPELTAQIKADERIPKLAHNITVKDLPVFAEWQRRIDKELGRV